MFNYILITFVLFVYCWCSRTWVGVVKIYEYALKLKSLRLKNMQINLFNFYCLIFYEFSFHIYIYHLIMKLLQ